jgi:hypothetical protein
VERLRAETAAAERADVDQAEADNAAKARAAEERAATQRAEEAERVQSAAAEKALRQRRSTEPPPRVRPKSGDPVGGGSRARAKSEQKVLGAKPLPQTPNPKPPTLNL